MTKDLFPVVDWNEKYSHMGVTPRELYMRQNGLCWLISDTTSTGERTVYCTDGKDKAQTSLMLNPTFECARCMAGFAESLLENANQKGRQEK